jgi:cell division protein ZapA
MNEELIPIAAQVGDRTYRIKVEPKNEALVLRTLQQIDQKLREFKTNFSGKDMQDYLAMTILWFATQPTTPAEAPPATTPATESNAGNDANAQAIAQELQLLEQLLDAEINRR